MVIWYSHSMETNGWILIYSEVRTYGIISERGADAFLIMFLTVLSLYHYYSEMSSLEERKYKSE